MCAANGPRRHLKCGFQFGSPLRRNASGEDSPISDGTPLLWRFVNSVRTATYSRLSGHFRISRRKNRNRLSTLDVPRFSNASDRRRRLGDKNPRRPYAAALLNTGSATRIGVRITSNVPHGRLGEHLRVTQSKVGDRKTKRFTPSTIRLH